MKKIMAVVVLILALILPVLAAEPEWNIEVGLDNSIAPSLIIATSTMTDDSAETDETMLGDPWGLIGVNLVAPAPKTVARVEMWSSTLIHPSAWEGVLPKKGETYLVCPLMKFDYDALLAVRQPFPEIVTARVTLNGQTLPEKSLRVPVRSINDCILAFMDEEGEVTDTSWLIAAYVNENHPVVDELLAEALRAGYVDSFAGYQKAARDVKKEMKAVYRAVQDRGFKYSNITRGSGESETVGLQHIRRIGDQIKATQANCVEGSVLFASVFRKLEMDPFLVSIPGHMFVGIYLDEDQEDYLCIETTMVGSDSFEDAVRTGNAELEEALPYITGKKKNTEAASDYGIIDIGAARQLGIMPIREAEADRADARLNPPAPRPAPAPAPSVPPPSVRPAPPAPVEKPAPAKGLQTVRIKELRASLDLPPDWETEVEKDSAGDPLFSASNEEGNLAVNIGIMPKTMGSSASAILKAYLEGAELTLDGAIEKITLSDRKAALAEAHGNMEGQAVRFKVMIVYGEQHAYVVQALAASKDYKAHAALFDQIIRSFDVP